MAAKKQEEKSFGTLKEGAPHWTQVVNIKRDPFETSIGQQNKTLFGQAGALAGPVTAYVYDWNLLPLGQQLWLKELQTYIDFPPMQDAITIRLGNSSNPSRSGEKSFV